MTETSADPIRPSTLAQLTALVGTVLGPTDWHDVTQQRIDAFADATGDHQWIHVDPERAASGPFGTTIAHGNYSLSLGPFFTAQLIAFDGFAHALNYGYNKVRFTAPLPVGSRIRMHATIIAVHEIAGGAQLTNKLTIEREGSAKPVLVAEAVGFLAERK
ncbi:MaoC family dehydratase [Rhodococcus sp. NPDC058514]|uniref:MaoC family dehydratase n=1 Tax=unclassified Rhodococcus (in: high G+C Gram-positive bacteria) TaxID=192944 RepID=UPI003654852D